MYKDRSRVSLYSRGFQEAFKRGVKEGKCVAVIVSPDERSQEIGQLLGVSSEITHQLNTRLVTVGITENSQGYIKLGVDIEVPCIIFAFETIFSKICILQPIRIRELSEEGIKGIIARYRDQRRKEKNIVIRHNNRIYAMYQEGERFMEEQILETPVYENQKLLRDEQRQEYSEAERVRKEQIREEEERCMKESIARTGRSGRHPCQKSRQKGSVSL